MKFFRILFTFLIIFFAKFNSAAEKSENSKTSLKHQKASEDFQKKISNIEKEIANKISETVPSFPVEISKLISQYTRETKQDIILNEIFNRDPKFQEIIMIWLQANYFNKEDSIKFHIKNALLEFQKYYNSLINPIDFESFWINISSEPGSIIHLMVLSMNDILKFFLPVDYIQKIQEILLNKIYSPKEIQENLKEDDKFIEDTYKYHKNVITYNVLTFIINKIEEEENKTKKEKNI